MRLSARKYRFHFLVIIFLIALALFGWQELERSRSTVTHWLAPVINDGEIAAFDWVKANTAKRDVFMACIFEGESLMGTTLRESVEGGDWAVVPNVIDQMAAADKFFFDSSGAEAASIAKRYNAKYAWVTKGRQIFCGYGWKDIPYQKFEDPVYFKKLFENDGVVIYGIN